MRPWKLASSITSRQISAHQPLTGVEVATVVKVEDHPQQHSDEVDCPSSLMVLLGSLISEGVSRYRQLEFHCLLVGTPQSAIRI